MISFFFLVMKLFADAADYCRIWKTIWRMKQLDNMEKEVGMYRTGEIHSLQEAYLRSQNQILLHIRDRQSLWLQQKYYIFRRDWIVEIVIAAALAVVSVILIFWDDISSSTNGRIVQLLDLIGMATLLISAVWMRHLIKHKQ